MKKVILSMLLFATSFLCQAQQAVLISAAASLKDCLTEIKSIYIKKHNHENVLINFGSSGSLQQQIEQGAPVDLFLSAGQKQMDALQSKQLLLPQSRRDLLINEMVLITPLNATIKTFADLQSAKVKKIAMGEPRSVPAGQYATQILDFYKLRDKLTEKFVFGKDVREVLTWVETGNADAGLVYKTDALISSKVKIIVTAPEETHPPVRYPIAIIKSSRSIERAKEFMNFLLSKEAGTIFEKYGFTFVSESN